MQKILNASFIYRFFAAIYGWFSRQWKQSRIISAFLAPAEGLAIFKTGIFNRLGKGLHGIMCSIFEKLRLTKLLEGSIFKKSFFWCTLPAVFAPILPTKFIILLAAAGFGSVLLQFCCDREKRLTFTPVNRFIVLYALVYVITTFTSVEFSASLYGGILTCFFVLFSLAFLSAIENRRQLDICLYLFIAAGTLVSLYGIFQYAMGMAGATAWLDSEMFSDISMRVYSTLDNPNVLSEYLLLIIPFACAWVLTAKTFKSRIAAICCVGIMCLCMVLTFSRGGWLGLLIAAAVFLVILDRRFIILGIIGLIGLYFILPETIINRFASIGNLTDGSTSYRLYIWMGTIAMLKDYWLCGIGPGTAAFNRVYPLYSFNAIAAPHSHNLFLQITCDCGIIGLIVFMLIIFFYYKTLCGSIGREGDRDSKIYMIASVSAISGFLVQSLTDYSFYNYRVMFMFWVILAFSMLLPKRSAMEKGIENG